MLSLSYREWDWIELPLDGKLRKPSPKNERHVYLTELELAELLEAVPERYRIERKVILLAMLTGMRRGELMALESGNIYNGRIVLRPNQTKNGKPRVIPLTEEALPLVESLPFDTTGDRVRGAFEKAREKIGRPDIRFHDLRHCYASLLASKGEALTSIRDLLGHSSLTVTSRYAHADPARWGKRSGDVAADQQPNRNHTLIESNPWLRNHLISLVGPVGLEPTTNRL